MFRQNAVESYSIKLKRFYELLNDMSLAGKLGLSMAMAVSIGLLAQIRVFLPWTPVPIVLTQLGIITSAAVMGRKWGVVPVAMYIAAGIAGIPWFSGNGSGLTYLLGPTGGYLIGFVAAAWFISHLVNSDKIKGRILPVMGIVALSQLLIIYIPGLLQLNYWLQAAGNHTLSLHGLLTMGFFPFIIGDVLKIIIGSLIVFSTARR